MHASIGVTDHNVHPLVSSMDRSVANPVFPESAEDRAGIAVSEQAGIFHDTRRPIIAKIHPITNETVPFAVYEAV